MTPLPPKVPNLPAIAALIAILANVSLVRELCKDGVWAALGRIRKGSHLILNPRMHMRLLKMLALPEFLPVRKVAPGLAFKYLGDYLGRSFSRKERVSILFDHYAFLKERVGTDFFHAIAAGRVLLWEHHGAGSVYRIWLTFPQSTHREGDLSLILQAGSVDIYTLSFSIGPGEIAGLSAGHAIYIARVQGKGGGFALIRQATKEMHEVSPAALLLAAAEGIAMALEVEDLVCISGTDQLSADQMEGPDAMVSTYDEFWLSMGGEMLSRNLYRLSVPLSEKPIESIERKHRSRVLRKREFKRGIKDAVSATFRNNALQSDRL